MAALKLNPLEQQIVGEIVEWWGKRNSTECFYAVAAALRVVISELEPQTAVEQDLALLLFKLLKQNQNVAPAEIFAAIERFVVDKPLAREAGSVLHMVASLPTERSKPVRQAAKAGTGKKIPSQRTVEGRAEYRRMIYDAIVALNDPAGVKAKKVRKLVGGKPQQTRTALNELIRMEKLKFSGQASGTRYFPASADS